MLLANCAVSKIMPLQLYIGQFHLALSWILKSWLLTFSQHKQTKTRTKAKSSKNQNQKNPTKNKKPKPTNQTKNQKKEWGKFPPLLFFHLRLCSCDPTLCSRWSNSLRIGPLLLPNWEHGSSDLRSSLIHRQFPSHSWIISISTDTCFYSPSLAKRSKLLTQFHVHYRSISLLPLTAKCLEGIVSVLHLQFCSFNCWTSVRFSPLWMWFNCSFPDQEWHQNCGVAMSFFVVV